MKQAIATVCEVVAVIVLLPIWFYLAYKVLIAVQATELMWFLFWIYVPASVLVKVLYRIVRDAK